MSDEATQLDWLYAHERERPDAPWLTQPLGKGALRDFSFAQGLDEARRMAAHLKARNFPPGSRIAIFSKNTAWWLLCDLAIWMAGHVSVPIYPTLTADSIRRILVHAEARLVFVGKLDLYAQMEPGLPKDIARVTMPLAPSEARAEGVPSWDDIVRDTAPIEGSPRRDADDLATIVYTSGSTGEPKGVMHSFRTMCAAAAFAEALSLGKDDRMISYLPLAHVAERACLQTTNAKAGYRVFFSESLTTFAADLRRARPTVFGGVPRIWQKLQEGVATKMPPQKLARLLRIPIVGRIVARKVLAGLGLDAATTCVTGSAPTPPDVHAFFRSLGLEIRELYGMTENFAVSHFARPGEARVGWVGTPAPGVVTRISDAGEVLVKSPGTMLGYYKNDALTRETVDAEGFLHTGDRGEIDERGALRINGRVKEIFKTSKGKYVAPAPIEGALVAHPEVDQACVTGIGRPQPHALVVLSAAARAADATKRRAMLAALEAHLDATNAGFDQHERLDKLVVVPDEWTSENGFLTPTLKLRRAVIEERYAEHVAALLERTERVVWLDAQRHE
jgi:long-chain acyl-CoA synthetase